MALAAIFAFLFQNGWLFDPDEAQNVDVIMGLAAGEVSEAELAGWIEANSTPR